MSRLAYWYIALVFICFPFISKSTCPNAGNLDAGTYTIDSGDGSCPSITWDGPYASSADITIQSGGTLTISTDFYLIMTGGSITVESGGTLVINGGGGGLSIDDGSTFTVNTGGIVTIGGNLDVGDYQGGNGYVGDVTINGAVSVGGDYTAHDGGSLDGAGSLDVTGTITEEAGSSSSAWTGSCSGGCGSLPVELVSFNGKQSGERSSILSWSTSSELNNDGFYIEKSLGNADFYEIGHVEGSGTTNVAQSYGFIDYQFVEDSYYRIRQVDYDGQFEYHDVILVQHRSAHQIEIFPNPVVTESITMGGPTNKIFDTRLLSISGIEIMNVKGSIKEIENSLNLLIPTLEPSIYIIRLISGSDSHSIRFIKK